MKIDAAIFNSEREGESSRASFGSCLLCLQGGFTGGFTRIIARLTSRIARDLTRARSFYSPLCAVLATPFANTRKPPCLNNQLRASTDGLNLTRVAAKLNGALRVSKYSPSHKPLCPIETTPASSFTPFRSPFLRAHLPDAQLPSFPI